MREVKTFDCRCGHMAHWVKRVGWKCMCQSPSPMNPPKENTPKARTRRGLSQKVVDDLKQRLQQRIHRLEGRG